MNTKVALLGVLFILTGCQSHRSVVKLGKYTFYYQGDAYCIESYTPNNVEGYNILSRRQGEHILLKAIDKEQDGYLDRVLIGNLSLEEAKEIYHVGIEEGEKQGYIKKRTFAREYQTSDSNYHFILSTYLLVVGEVYNKLTVESRYHFTSEVTVLDKGADGNLDQMERGEGSLDYYQKLYTEVLNRGLREGRIERSDGLYIVSM